MQPGTVLVEKYRLESLIGHGGMGTVWRAEHLGLNAPVAVKLMAPSMASSVDAAARFHREAHAAASIRSQHVVQVLDHGIDRASQTPFIVMELLEGETLGQRLARQKRISPAQTLRILGDVCRALGRAHQASIVHRDLKPDNIFLVRDEHEIAKVLDFGVAKADAHAFALGGGGLTGTGALIGTPGYMSPEQISGSKQIDWRSDLWSLGVIACECITGQHLFQEDTVGGLVLAICVRPLPRASDLGPASAAFEAWLARALERDPERRFQSAAELIEALAPACAEAAQPLPSPAHTPAPAQATPVFSTMGAAVAPSRPRERHSKLWLALALGTVCIAFAAWRLLSLSGDAAVPSVVSAPAAPAPDSPAALPAERPTTVPAAPTEPEGATGREPIIAPIREPIEPPVDVLGEPPAPRTEDPERATRALKPRPSEPAPAAVKPARVSATTPAPAKPATTKRPSVSLEEALEGER
ncbi:MAG TPA: protein kinase [Polyangiaceae bacterium]|nr:protein kinase [Polyangiaceae bacterium]